MTGQAASTGRLYGRGTALATTGAALADASRGAGGLLLVAGEPGIGKSAVLAEQARRAAAEGVRVLRGAGWEEAGAPPYWLWLQAVRGLTPDERAGVSFSAAGGAAAGDAADARFRLFDAIGQALAAAGPLLVVLDDLQWADDGSLRLLDFLRRTLSAERVLLLGAYRESAAGPMLAELAGSASVVPLPGLAVDEVATLMAAVAGRTPDAALATVVHRRCAGNPFFVRELTRLMIARSTWSAAEVTSPDVVPAGIHDTLQVRLARLSRPCVDLLELAAVAGAVVDPALLIEVGPDDGAAIAELLGEAERARVLVPASGILRFAHDLYREAVLAGTAPARRARLHRAVGHALLALSGDGADPAAVGGAARLAAHFVAAGPDAAPEALRWTVEAGHEATRRLGHGEAARHFTTALRLLPDVHADPARRVELLLELAAAQDRSGHQRATREAYLRAAELARRSAAPAALAEAALGLAALGTRTGTADPISVGLLEEAAALLAPGKHGTENNGSDALRSRVLAALARALRHGGSVPVDPRADRAAADAVELARATGDPAAVGHALLARHDIVWAPGRADLRLPLLAEMSTAARAAGDGDLVAEAVLLRAAVLIEQGDPAGPGELLRYTQLADRLGHARGRWGALSRRATLAQMFGRVDESVSLAEAAWKLGREIELPDAMGVFGTLRGSLAAIGASLVPLTDLMPAADPVWPIYPLLQAWGMVNSGDLDRAAASITGFSVRAVPAQYDLEAVSVAAVVFAAVGTFAQREWAYAGLAPHAGLHVVIGGCAAYHGVVDHQLGLLAAALGRTDAATRHFAAAVELHERLGTAAWGELSRAELRRLSGPGHDCFRRSGRVWELAFDGRRVHLADAKGLNDIAALLAAPGEPVHVFTLLGRPIATAGADPVLDHRAVAAYRTRMTELDAEIDEAAAWSDGHRATRARAERDAVVAELRAATGLGGRARRLGDDRERARKTVAARVKDALRRIDEVHPELAAHLRAALHTGTECFYAPDQPRRWSL